MQIVGLNHVQITIPKGADAERVARSFYLDVLGLTEISKPESLAGRGGFWADSPAGPPVHFGTEDDVDRLATKAHVAYEVEDLPAWRTRLTEAGVSILESVPIPGHERFECRDPFGNRVELICPD